FKEYGLQDSNTLEATQRMLESRVVTDFPLNDQEILLRHLRRDVQVATQRMLESRVVTDFPLNDQEILLRHLHVTARNYVDEYLKQQPGTPVSISAAS